MLLLSFLVFIHSIAGLLHLAPTVKIMPRIHKRTVCSRCLLPRYPAALDRNGLCDSCLEETRQQMSVRAPSRLEEKLAVLCRTDEGGRSAIAGTCQALFEQVGGPAGLVRWVNEYLVHEPGKNEQPLDRPDAWRAVVSERQAFLAGALLNCLGILEEQQQQDDRQRMTRLKAMREYTNEELRDVLVPIATDIVRKNPGLAARCLRDAGYQVTLRKAATGEE